MNSRYLWSRISLGSERHKIKFQTRMKSSTQILHLSQKVVWLGASRYILMETASPKVTTFQSSSRCLKVYQILKPRNMNTGSRWLTTEILALKSSVNSHQNLKSVNAGDTTGFTELIIWIVRGILIMKMTRSRSSSLLGPHTIHNTAATKRDILQTSKRWSKPRQKN